MSVITIPSGLQISRQVWGQQRNDVEVRSVFGAQSFEGSSPLWSAALIAPDMKAASSGEWQALLMSLAGRTNQLSMHCMSRPEPLGTMRGSMLFGATATAGDVSITISASGQGSTTLLKGDLLGFGSGLTQQVVMVTADATADVSGVITVTVEPPLRAGYAIGEALVWDKPQVLFRRSQTQSGWSYQNQVINGFSLDLLEDNRP